GCERTFASPTTSRSSSMRVSLFSICCSVTAIDSCTWRRRAMIHYARFCSASCQLAQSCQNPSRTDSQLALMTTKHRTSSRTDLTADLIIINANIQTMDRANPTASAVAILGRRIIAVGANDDIRQLAGPATKVIDAEGRLVLPGFNDAHVHLMSGGFQLSSVDLRDAGTPQELAERIREFA